MKHILLGLTLVLALISGNAVAQGNAEDQKIMSRMNTGAYTGPFLHKDVKPLCVIQDELDYYKIEISNLKEIEPDWIEKAEVLKGESAVEIFGESARYGAIVIILKDEPV